MILLVSYIPRWYCMDDVVILRELWSNIWSISFKVIFIPVFHSPGFLSSTGRVGIWYFEVSSFNGLDATHRKLWLCRFGCSQWYGNPISLWCTHGTPWHSWSFHVVPVWPQGREVEGKGRRRSLICIVNIYPPIYCHMTNVLEIV